MKQVRAGARDHLHLAAGIASIFGFAARCCDAHFAQGVGVGGGHGEAETRGHRVVGVDSVQGGVVAALARAVDARVAAVTGVDRGARRANGAIASAVRPTDGSVSISRSVTARETCDSPVCTTTVLASTEMASVVGPTSSFTISETVAPRPVGYR